jgi:spore coat polysaccharide biosynthesis predicted glycosyltransferase SpsG
VDGSIAPSFRHGFGSALTFGGPAYMVLDPTFRELHRRPLPIRREIRSVLVSLGGGDAREYFRRVLEGLRLWAAKSERDVEVVATRGFVDWGQERFGESAAKPLHLRWESQPVGALLRGMRDVDLAITAGGVSAYEALCAGTPLLALSWDSLQQTTIRLIEAAGGCVNLGAGKGLLPGHLAEQLEKIDADAGAREELSRRGMEIVDGRGAERVATIIRRAIKCGRRDRRGATRVTDDADTGEQSENLLELVG